MGGQPLMALNLVAFPPELPPAILTDILRGAAEKVHEAGAVIAGGHTIQDKEPKFGLAVIGLTHPDQLATKAQARPGDLLILTKPLGTGTITTAAKRDAAESAHIAEAQRWMSRLNRSASRAAGVCGARGITDITGFGLLGHAAEMAAASEVSLEMSFAAIPFMTGAVDYASKWIFPGGSASNKQAFEPSVRFDTGVTAEQQMLLFDAQTSGGLLIALPAGQRERFAAEMARNGDAWWHIGSVQARREAAIYVSP